MKLKTERLILRKPRMSDWKEYYDCVNNFQTCSMMKDFKWPLDKEYVKSKIKRAKEEWKKEEPQILYFFIELKESGKIIGDVVLHSINNWTKELITGSMIHKDYRRKRYMHEAKIAMLKYVFNEMNMEKIISDVFVDNLPSNEAIKKLGFKFKEKKIRWSTSQATGKRHDVNFYELTKEDWKKISSKLKKELKEKIKRLEK